MIFGIGYGIGQKYWLIRVSVSVWDLNQNSGFGRSLFLPVLRRDAFDCWHASISKYEPISRFQTGLEYRLEILRPPKQVRPRFLHVKRPKEVPRMLAKWLPRKKNEEIVTFTSVVVRVQWGQNIFEVVCSMYFYNFPPKTFSFKL